MASQALDLGPFAPEQGPTSPWSAAAGLLGAAAFAVAFVAVALDAANVTTFHSRSLVLPVSVVALVAGIIGLYQVSASGRRGKLFATWGIALAAVGGIAAFVHGGVQGGTLKLGDFGSAYFDRTVLGEIWRDMLHGAVNTIKYAGLSEVLGIVLGLVVATFAVSHRTWLRLPAIAYVDVVRGLPLLMMLLLVYFGLTYIGVTLQTAVAAVAALTINSSAYIAEIFRAGIQSIERGQMDAARSLGMPYATAMIHVIIPQAVRRVIPPLTNEFIALVKDSSLIIVLGTTVATRELLTTARQSAATTFSATPYMAASLLYLAITLPLTRVVNVLERKLNPTGATRSRLKLMPQGTGTPIGG